MYPLSVAEGLVGCMEKLQVEGDAAATEAALESIMAALDDEGIANGFVACIMLFWYNKTHYSTNYSTIQLKIILDLHKRLHTFKCLGKVRNL